MNAAFAKRFLPALIVTSAVGLAAAGGCGSGGGTSSIPPNYTLPTPLPSATASATPTPTPSATPSESPSPTPTPTPTPNGPVSATGQFQDLIFTLTTPKRAVAVGETIPLTFTVQNTGTTDVVLSSSQPYFALGQVSSAAGTYVSSFPGVTVSRKTSRQTANTLTIPAGQTQTFTLEWGSQSLNATPFAQTTPGTYAILCSVFADTVDGVAPTEGLNAAELKIVVR